MTLLLVAHGTRTSAGVGTIGEIAERVGEQLRRAVQVAFVDVLGPAPSEVLATAAGDRQPAIVVPAFLSRGYHVRVDVPAQVAASGHSSVTVTPALGPGPRVVRVLAQRLAESGWQPGDSVVLAAAGTSDRSARADLNLTAHLLSNLIWTPVRLAFAATGEPTVGDAVATLRAGGARRVAIASYLLADGVFQQRLRDAGADVVAAPLGAHAGITLLIADRFKTACGPARSGFFGHRQQQRGIFQGVDRVHSRGHHQ